jgi:hypothetical protein
MKNKDNNISIIAKSIGDSRSPIFDKLHILYVLVDNNRIAEKRLNCYLLAANDYVGNPEYATKFLSLQGAIAKLKRLKRFGENVSICKIIYQEVSIAADALYPYRSVDSDDMVYIHHNHYGYLEEYYNSSAITTNRFIDRQEFTYEDAVKIKETLGAGWNIRESYMHKPKKVKLKYVRKEKSKTIKILRKVYSEVSVW